MSGHTPRHAFTVSKTMGAPDSKIEVDPEALQELRAQIPISREESMQWVNPEFNSLAEAAFQAIGAPDLSILSSGWDIW
jgi:hypothetical protein